MSPHAPSISHDFLQLEKEQKTPLHSLEVLIQALWVYTGGGLGIAFLHKVLNIYSSLATLPLENIAQKYLHLGNKYKHEGSSDCFCIQFLIENS